MAACTRAIADQHAATIHRTRCQTRSVGSRTVQGWARVDAPHIESDPELAGWVGIGVS
jgi:hypothetical protein